MGLDLLELLVAHGAPDRPRVVVPPSPRRLIDHPASWDASERPRQDHDIEVPVGERKLLSDADLELHVRGAELMRFRAREADRRRIRIDADDLRRVRRTAERHTAVATADIDHA